MSDAGHLDHKPFSMTWMALKLLGKNLYSHPWSAVSELVANGIDAKATQIYVHIDTSDGKDNARLEVLDNGIGMTNQVLDSYVTIGFDKRKADHIDTIENPMGRKGIGKLAALYLSHTYNLLTKVMTGEENMWECTISERTGDTQTPSLSRLSSDQAIKTPLTKKWKSFKSGTIVQVFQIDLKTFGEKAFEGLEYRLANHFLLSSLKLGVDIYFAYTQNPGETPEFKKVEKQIASKNFLHLIHHGVDQKYPKTASTVQINIGSKRQSLDVKIEKMSSSDSLPLKGKLSSLEGFHDYPPSLTYSLTGWLGMHASINKETAQINDPRFTKNKYYSASQIRLYVRGKLALDNVLPLLGTTQTYQNYIEGEISFDILDDSSLPDIATTSREGFDTSDPRMELLCKLLSQQVRHLINTRNQQNKTIDEERREIANKASLEAAKLLEKEAIAAGIPKEHAPTITKTFTSYLANSSDVEYKTEYVVFISHASKDKYFSDLVWQLLRNQGALPSEVFYTSRDQKRLEEPSDLQDLENIIRNHLKSSNTRVAYVTGNAFLSSQYCLFEAGAGWALRTRNEFDILAAKYENVPHFFQNGRVISELFYLDETTKRPKYNRRGMIHLFETINRLIRHLNHGRRINSKNELPEYDIHFPEDAELVSRNKSLLSVFDDLQHVKEALEIALERYASTL